MSEEIASVTDLSRRFGGTLALDRVTLSIARGAIFGLVGENGAGKTTLLRLLAGEIRHLDDVVARGQGIAVIG